MGARSSGIIEMDEDEERSLLPSPPTSGSSISKEISLLDGGPRGSSLPPSSSSLSSSSSFLPSSSSKAPASGTTSAATAGQRRSGAPRAAAAK